jgi:adenosylcobinamide-phosphate synthase
MGFVALILALLLEQVRPLSRDNPVHRTAAGLADWVARSTDAGDSRHGALGWSLAVGPACVAVLLGQWLLELVHPVLVLVLHVAVLYFTLGFRQFSHAFTEIQLALAANDPAGARQVLQTWMRQSDPSFDASDLSVTELCRVAISHALISAHRYVFGPLFWYMILPGAVGPVLYRAAQFLAERWALGGHGRALKAGAAPGPVDASPVSGSEPYGRFSAQAYRLLDWLPARLGAAGFAIVGNFEDAIYCWRSAATIRGGDEQRRILLMTGGGALGLRIADPRLDAEVRAGSALPGDTDPTAANAPGSSGFDWTGAEPDANALRSSVGLVWRAVVLWILLFAMLTIANWLGR